MSEIHRHLIHDGELINRLEDIPVRSWDGTVFRVTWENRDPLGGSVAGGRWSPRDQFEVLYTSLNKDGAITEIDFRFSLEPIRPTRPVMVHEIQVELKKTREISTISELEPLGVDVDNYDSLDYSHCQEIGAAANFLECDGLLVPNARYNCQNLIIFLGNYDTHLRLSIESSERVDWEFWKPAELFAEIRVRWAGNSKPTSP